MSPIGMANRLALGAGVAGTVAVLTGVPVMELRLRDRGSTYFDEYDDTPRTSSGLGGTLIGATVGIAATGTALLIASRFGVRGSAQQHAATLTATSGAIGTTLGIGAGIVGSNARYNSVEPRAKQLQHGLDRARARTASAPGEATAIPVAGQPSLSMLGILGTTAAVTVGGVVGAQARLFSRTRGSRAATLAGVVGGLAGAAAAGMGALQLAHATGFGLANGGPHRPSGTVPSAGSVTAPAERSNIVFDPYDDSGPGTVVAKHVKEKGLPMELYRQVGAIDGYASLEEAAEHAVRDVDIVSSSGVCAIIRDHGSFVLRELTSSGYPPEDFKWDSDAGIVGIVNTDGALWTVRGSTVQRAPDIDMDRSKYTGLTGKYDGPTTRRGMRDGYASLDDAVDAMRIATGDQMVVHAVEDSDGTNALLEGDPKRFYIVDRLKDRDTRATSEPSIPVEHGGLAMERDGVLLIAHDGYYFTPGKITAATYGDPPKPKRAKD